MPECTDGVLHYQSAFYGKPKADAERFAVLDKVYDEGDLVWDTADVYQDSEDLLGEFLPIRRS